MATASERLGEYVSSVRYEDIPEKDRIAAKRMFLDTLGCVIGGFDEPQCRIAREAAAELGGPPESTILVSGERVCALNAVLGNGVAVRAIDLMDQYRASDGIHPSEFVFAPALAMAEREKTSGEAVIAAVVLGYEVAMRLAELSSFFKKGWDPGSINGQFASPVVAGRILGLDAQQMANAISISGTHNIGIVESITGKRACMMKDAQHAFVAQSGVLAALLARRGFTGASEVFEGPRGLWRQFGMEVDADRLLKGFNHTFRISRCGLKDYNYAVVASAQPAVEACFMLHKEHRLTAEVISAARVRTFSWAVNTLTSKPVTSDFTLADAQFSGPYVFATALHYGALSPEHMHHADEPAIQTLGSRIRVELDPDIEREYPSKLPAIVEVQTTDGRRLTKRVEYRRGDPENPLTDKDLEYKFRRLAEEKIGVRHTASIIERVWNLEKLNDISELTALCRAS
jgi:2-methylcitrate dehydratase